MAASTCLYEHVGCRWQGQVKTYRRGDSEVVRMCEDARVRGEGRHSGSAGRICIRAHVDVDAALETMTEQQRRRRLE